MSSDCASVPLCICAHARAYVCARTRACMRAVCWANLRRNVDFPCTVQSEERDATGFRRELVKDNLRRQLRCLSHEGNTQTDIRMYTETDT